MGTIRNNFVAAFLSFALMSSTSQSFWVRGSSEDSLKRNNSTDTLRDSYHRLTSTSNYECLYLNPNLPPCDFRLMLNSEELASNKKLFKRDVERNIDVSNVDVTVYTIEGCLPSRLPLKMPSCDGISLDRIVDIRKLRPFFVKGVTKPPLVFPKLNYSRWLRMTKQLQNHAPAKTRHETGSSDVQDLTEEQISAATTNETMPNATANSMKTSKGSSQYKLVPPDNTKSPESTDQLTKSPVNDGNSARSETSLNTEIPPILQYRNELISESKSNGDHSRSNSDGNKRSSLNTSEIPAVRKNRLMNEEIVMKEPSNVHSDYANSQKSLQFSTGVQMDETDNGVVDDLPLTEIASAALRIRREVRFHEIGDEPEVRTVTGEPISRRFQRYRETPSFHLNQFYDSAELRRQSGVRVDEQEMINKNVPMVRIPVYRTKADFKSMNKIKYDGWSGSKTTWQKTKKYRR